MGQAASNNARTAGVVLLVAAAILGGVFLATRSDDAGTPFCVLSAAGLSSLTVAAHQEKSTAAILTTVGLPLACAAFVDAVAEDKTVKAAVELPEGETETYEVSGRQLVETASAPSQDTSLDQLHRRIECIRWNNEILSQMCSENRIEPPANAAF